MALTQVLALGLPNDVIEETKIADDGIDSEHYNDGSIDNAHLADDAVGIAELSATGTASSSTFLRGDNSWQAISTTPEGTAILSTGETGTAKFLRVDGDNSSSWQVPPDTTYSVGDGGLTQNNFTNTLKTKLDGIATSANAYVHPNHSGEVTSTADGATVIASDTVDEDNLKVDNSPTNDYVLTAKSSAAGGLTWAAAAAGGVLQVKSAHRDTYAATGHSSATYVDVNTVTITPAATGSSFLCCYSARSYQNANGDNCSSLQLIRNVNAGGFSVLREQNAILVDQEDNARAASATSWYLDTPTYSAGNALIYKSQQNRAHGSDSVDIGRYTDLVVIELANGIAT